MFAFRFAATAALIATANAQQVVPHTHNLVLPVGYDSPGWGTAACNDASNQDCCCATLTKNGGACDSVERILCFSKAEAARVHDDHHAHDHGATAGASTTDGQLWIITCGIITFLVVAGLAMFEVGSVPSRGTKNILFKHTLNACLCVVCWWLLGYAFAFADGTPKGDEAGFIGKTNFALWRESKSENGLAMFFFQFTRALVAATIVSGGLAERTALHAYLIFTVLLVSFIYPVVAHWVWSSNGWLSALGSRTDRFEDANGMFDYAGSGVVHMVGGWAGLCGAWVVGPRIGRFSHTLTGELQVNELGQSSRGPAVFQTLGALFIWIGFFGLTCGSTLAANGANAGKVATNVIIAAAFGGLVGQVIARVHSGYYVVCSGLYGILAGLVSISAGCALVDEWCAMFIGAIGAIFAYGAMLVLPKLNIDDPLSVGPIHGVGGLWGVISVGIFTQSRNIVRAYGGEPTHDNDYHVKGKQLGVQCLGALCILVWTVGLSIIFFMVIKFTLGVRISEPEEVDQGLDIGDHEMLPRNMEYTSPQPLTQGPVHEGEVVHVLWGTDYYRATVLALPNQEGPTPDNYTVQWDDKTVSDVHISNIKKLTSQPSH